jgi:hypothetical protein
MNQEFEFFQSETAYFTYMRLLSNIRHSMLEPRRTCHEVQTWFFRKAWTVQAFQKVCVPQVRGSYKLGPGILCRVTETQKSNSEVNGRSLDAPTWASLRGHRGEVYRKHYRSSLGSFDTLQGSEEKVNL